jgi:hypothetical protein
MARVYRILGQKNPGSSVLTNVYTVPAANSAVVSSIVLTNTSGSAGGGVAARLAVNAEGVVVATSNYLAYDVNIPGCDSVTMTLGITMNAGSQLSVYANSTSLAVSVFGTEIY